MDALPLSSTPPVGGAAGSDADASAPMAVLDLAQAPASARVAREFVVSVTGVAEHVRVAVVVTELVTNAVVHAHSRPRLGVAFDGMTVELRVEDDDPQPPVLHQGDTIESSGRGLVLVNGMADAWGVDERPGQRGKVVWARVRLD